MDKKRQFPKTLALIIILGVSVWVVFASDFSMLVSGYLAILRSPSILTSDYLKIGGLSATLFNVVTILLLNIAMVRRLNIHVTGPVIAGIMTIAGFSFFGKNLFNTLPIYLGIYLFARSQNLEFKNFIIVVLFSTGISPLVSFMVFGMQWGTWLGLPALFNPLIGGIAGIGVGVFTGFILPTLSAHTIRFHKGYNLYNVGFALGIVSMVFSAILRSFDAVDLNQGGQISEAYHTELYVFTIVISVLFILYGVLSTRILKTEYPRLLKSSGRLVSDFVHHHGMNATLLNIGIMGLLSIAVITVMDFRIHGPLMGGILTVMGFAAFGKHPRNTIPLMIGAVLAVWISDYSFESAGMVTAVLFVTALAPVAGRYGVLIGILAGFLHIMVTPLALNFQEGGFNLYNNGFAAGFIAALIIPFMEMLHRNKGDGAL